MATKQTKATFVLGDRVILTGSHSRAGERGQIVGSHARAFNGWTVKLDNGLYVGADDRQMHKDDKS